MWTHRGLLRSSLCGIMAELGNHLWLQCNFPWLLVPSTFAYSDFHLNHNLSALFGWLSVRSWEMFRRGEWRKERGSWPGPGAILLGVGRCLHGGLLGLSGAKDPLTMWARGHLISWSPGGSCEHAHVRSSWSVNCCWDISCLFFSLPLLPYLSEALEPELEPCDSLF